MPKNFSDEKSSENLPINQVVTGDCRDVMSDWPSECIDFVMFSPPYWGLRDYGEEAESVWGGDKDCDHEWGKEVYAPTKNATQGSTENKKWKSMEETQNGKGGNFCQKCGAWRGQFGLEPDYRMYVQHLVEIGRGIKRILKPSGSWYLNLGDTYCNDSHVRRKSSEAFQRKGDDGYEDSLAESREESGRTRRTLSDIDIPSKCKLLIPHRVALALIDDGWICRNDLIWLKPNPMPSSAKDRLNTTTEKIFHFVKEKKYYYDLDAIREEHSESSKNRMEYDFKDTQKRQETRENNPMIHHDLMKPNPNGKNPGDVIEQVTIPSPEAHFAVYPPDLCEKPIKSSCPPDGIVLDPMCGAGSTLIEARRLGRNYIGIEISDEYAEIARERLAKGDEEYKKRKRKERKLERQAEELTELEAFC